MRETVLELAARFLPDVIAIRRHLHQYPELSFQEEQTSRFVAEQLSAMGVSFTPHVAGHGIVAILEGQNPGKRVFALRADMDALPILEANDTPYTSRHAGVMHACGHDVHTAALLGAIRILQALRAHWEGTIKCLFQPGEELLPGGASLMIKAGALENPRPTAIVGQHVAPDIPVGKVGFKSGMYMASADELYLTVKGKGGHGAMPHLAVDPVLVAAHIITALQQITSRNAHPALPTVLTLGKIQSKGGATNIIPEEVLIEGTFRTFDEDWRQEAHERMQKIVAGVAEGMGATCDFRIERGYPVLHNHEMLTQRARQAAIELLGAEQVIELPIRMTSEDFAWYTHVIPGCFYRLGTRNESKGIVSGVHTPTFDIDETALQTGMALMAWFAIRDIF